MEERKVTVGYSHRHISQLAMANMNVIYRSVREVLIKVSLTAVFDKKDYLIVDHYFFVLTGL